MPYTQQNGYHVIPNIIYTAVTECSCENCGTECEGDCCQGPGCCQEEIEQPEDLPEISDFTD
jgi:hypothetical protein